MINDFVFLRFRARAPEDLSAIEVISPTTSGNFSAFPVRPKLQCRPLRHRPLWHTGVYTEKRRRYLSHGHTGSYDFLIVRLVAIWRTCDRSAMFATISRSGGRILRSIFLAGGRSSYDWSYAWSRDQQRLEKIGGMIHHIIGNRTTSGSHKRSIVRSSVAPDDRSYDQSWNSATYSVGRRMGSDLNPITISTFYIVSEQSIGGITGRKVARPDARLIVRQLMIWNRRLQVLNMTIDLFATDLPLAITHDLCDQSYVLFTIGPRFHHFSIAGRL